MPDAHDAAAGPHRVHAAAGLALLAAAGVLLALFITPHGSALTERLHLTRASPRILEVEADQANVTLLLVDAPEDELGIEGELHGFGLPGSRLAAHLEAVSAPRAALRYRIESRGRLTDVDGLVTLRVPAARFDALIVSVGRGNIEVQDATRSHLLASGRIHLELHTGARPHSGPALRSNAARAPALGVRAYYAPGRASAAALANGSVMVTMSPPPTGGASSSMPPPSSAPPARRSRSEGLEVLMRRGFQRVPMDRFAPMRSRRWAAVAAVMLVVTAPRAHAGIDHLVPYDDSGIWKRSNQEFLEYGLIAAEVGGALWEGGETRLGRTFWTSIDSSVAAGLVSQVMKVAFSRVRPRDSGGDPHLWFQGHGNESFPSGEVTMVSSIVTPFVLEYAHDHPGVYALELLPLYDSIARVKVQSHWQTDVLAGWALGTGAAWLIHRSPNSPFILKVMPHGIYVGIGKSF